MTHDEENFEERSSGTGASKTAQEIELEEQFQRLSRVGNTNEEEPDTLNPRSSDFLIDTATLLKKMRRNLNSIANPTRQRTRETEMAQLQRDLLWSYCTTRRLPLPSSDCDVQSVDLLWSGIATLAGETRCLVTRSPKLTRTRNTQPGS